MKRSFGDYVRNFIGGLALGALTALPACTTEIQSREDNNEQSINVEAIDSQNVETICWDPKYGYLTKSLPGSLTYTTRPCPDGKRFLIYGFSDNDVNTDYEVSRSISEALGIKHAVSKIIAEEETPMYLWAADDFESLRKMDMDSDFVVNPSEALRYLQQMSGREFKTVEEVKNETELMIDVSKRKYYQWFNGKIASLRTLLLASPPSISGCDYVSLRTEKEIIRAKSMGFYINSEDATKFFVDLSNAFDVDGPDPETEQCVVVEIERRPDDDHRIKNIYIHSPRREAPAFRFVSWDEGSIFDLDLANFAESMNRSVPVGYKFIDASLDYEDAVVLLEKHLKGRTGFGK